jgi:molybdate transport system substrate-binding protein
MIKRLFLISFAFVVITSSLNAKEDKTLLFYCGITMVKPMQEIAKKFSEQNGCTIQIAQGSSQDLYDSLKLAQKGDFYLPGSDSYLKNNMQDGFFKKSIYVGFNQVAIFVKKGNPKKIKSLDDFTNDQFSSVICDPRSGSIGRITKKILTQYKGEDFFYDVFDMATEIGTDSRSLNNSLKKPQIDMSLNWRATAFFDKNKEYISVVDIDEEFAPKKKLMLTTLTFTKYPKLADKFLEYVDSKEGKEIMRSYGFLK